MINIKIKDIVEAVDGVLLCGNENQEIEHISIDSRQSKGNDLFVPIIGEKVDAHNFISQAFDSGCIATLTSKHKEMNHTHSFIYVKDTIKALHDIGRLCRSRTTVPVVGVTGSVGKTTTREMIATALSAEKSIYKTGKNYNSQIGVPITLSEMPNDVDMAVLELGMNVPGELGLISKMTILDAAVVTNVGVAHIEFFGTKEKICEEKLTITSGLKENGLLFLNGDDELLYQYKDSTSFTPILYGTSPRCTYRGENIAMKNGKYTFEFVFDTIRIPVTLSVLGVHNVVNAIGALAVAHKFGVDLTKAAKALEGFTGFMNRLEVHKVNGYTIIDDTYNASPDSMKAGIDVLCGMEEKGKKIAVLGDMFELGEQSSNYHYQVGKAISEKPFDFAILVGKQASYIGKAMEDTQSNIPIMYEMSNEEVSKYLKRTLTAGDVVYLKASNGMKLKEITASLLS